MPMIIFNIKFDQYFIAVPMTRDDSYAVYGFVDISRDQPVQTAASFVISIVQPILINNIISVLVFPLGFGLKLYAYRKDQDKKVKKIKRTIIINTIIAQLFTGGMQAIGWSIGLELEIDKGRRVSSLWLYTSLIGFVLGSLVLPFVLSLAPKIVWQMKLVYRIANTIKAIGKYAPRDMFLQCVWDERTEEEIKNIRMVRLGLKLPLDILQLAKKKQEDDALKEEKRLKKLEKKRGINRDEIKKEEEEKEAKVKADEENIIVQAQQFKKEREQDWDEILVEKREEEKIENIKHMKKEIDKKEDEMYEISALKDGLFEHKKKDSFDFENDDIRDSLYREEQAKKNLKEAEVRLGDLGLVNKKGDPAEMVKQSMRQSEVWGTWSQGEGIKGVEDSSDAFLHLESKHIALEVQPNKGKTGPSKDKTGPNKEHNISDSDHDLSDVDHDQSDIEEKPEIVIVKRPSSLKSNIINKLAIKQSSSPEKKVQGSGSHDWDDSDDEKKREEDLQKDQNEQNDPIFKSLTYTKITKTRRGKSVKKDNENE